MFRRWHSLTGLILGLLLIVTSISGAILAIEPTLDRIENPSIPQGVSVAALAEKVVARHESVSRIAVRPNGAVTVSYADGEQSGVERVDPSTGAGLGPYQNSEASLFVTNLHRAFLAGDVGRDIAAASAAGILVLSISGLFLLARRQGGWSQLLRPAIGEGAQRLHAEVARIAIAGLLVLSLSGVWMSADWLGLVPQPPRADLTTGSGGPAAPLGALQTLRNTELASLKELNFPSPMDPEDVFTLKTGEGETQIDPANGDVLAFTPVTAIDRVQDFVRMMHTGRGVWALGLVLGLSSAAVPVLAVSGTLIWLRRRRVAVVASRDASRKPSTVILVGSEGNVTWGFAHALSSALAAEGCAIRIAAMNDVSQDDLEAQRVLILTSTYGQGDAPASASDFLARLKTIDGKTPFAVLGFGDRRFKQFCGFAEQVSHELTARGWQAILPLGRVDRQSAEAFAQWGDDLGRAMGVVLKLEHTPERPRRNRVRNVAASSDVQLAPAPAAVPVRAREGARRVG